MRQAHLLCGLLALCTLVGCGGEQVRSATENGFPDYLVGVWQSDKFDWAFKFEPDGSIERLHHGLGGPMTTDYGVVELPGPDPGTFALFTLGEVHSNYDPKTQILSVQVNLDAFHMQLPSGSLIGRSEDFFDGPVSPKTMTWQANWRNYTYLEEADPPDRELIEANPEPLVFTKVDLDAIGDPCEAPPAEATP